MGKKEAYLEKRDAQLRRYSAEIDKMKAKAEEAKADLKIKYYRQLETLDAKRNDARQKLHQLRMASGDAWEDLTSGIEIAWRELKTSVGAAVSHFKQ